MSESTVASIEINDALFCPHFKEVVSTDSFMVCLLPTTHKNVIV